MDKQIGLFSHVFKYEYYKYDTKWVQWFFKEAQISNEKRLDLVITFFQYQYIIELKIWHGPVAHQKGLLQLADYLDRQNIEEGYLLIYDFRKLHQSQDKEWVEVNGKRIYVVWV